MGGGEKTQNPLQGKGKNAESSARESISSLRASEASVAIYESKNRLLRCFRFAQTASQ
ncbi:hypothetical protein ACWIUD_08060 [Helicobacter sp. 23-1044]